MNARSETGDSALTGYGTLGELIRRAVVRYGEREAIVQGAFRLTFRQMGERISQIMQALEAQGVGRESAICQLTVNNPDALMIRAAANLLGARLTVLNPLSSPADHAFIADDSNSDVLIIDPGFEASAALILDSVPSIAQALLTAADLSKQAAAFAPCPLWDAADPDDICHLVYTGGTTGQPKGVMHRHRAFVASSVTMCAEFEWPPDIRFLAATPLSHAAGGLVVPAWMRGGAVHLQNRFEPEAFLDCVERERITAAWLVPTMLHRLLESPSLDCRDLSSLGLVIYGGSPIQPALMQRALDRFGPIFLQLYAQREASMPVTTLNRWDHDRDSPGRLGSCGIPAPSLQVKIMDDDDQEVAQGATGEICVRGPVVMAGYWRRSEESAAALKNGWLHTGDMGRADEAGFITIVDRKKDMLITGGFNVYPKEVEDVLTQHPAVAQAAVIGVPDDKWGERVTAVVVARDGMDVSAEELIELVKQHKGSVHAPKAVDFADSIPVTATGKPDKRALRARYWSGESRQVH